jgi:calcineurin-like phosphoesterase family protein
MIFYTSDLHFGHANAIRFDNRPFRDVGDMEERLIENWNETVGGDDEVYILGDFCFGLKKDPALILKKLRGRKHLIQGNHDNIVMKSQEALTCFETIDKMRYVKDGDKLIVMCHFPIADWNKKRNGAYHFYGHIHADRSGVYEFMKRQGRAYNVGCMINGYRPCTADEIIQNNIRFEHSGENGCLEEK